MDFDKAFSKNTSEYWQRQGHQLANHFAQKKADEFMRMFMQESGLMKELKKLKPEEEWDMVKFQGVFGKYLALAFAMGYLDGLEKKKLGKIYV